jgi:hydrogen peroxide-dependent heme synthase
VNAETNAPDPTFVTTSVGWGVFHIFARITPQASAAQISAAVEATIGDDHQVVPFAVFGHKADVGFMALGPDLWRLRRLQTLLQHAGLEVIDSYVSMTEVSEYAAGMPDDMKSPRLHPELPPADKHAFCFYPMSKKRVGDDNWFTLEYDRRKELMYEHGASGRNFRGRILQVVTGSTGVDDFEWGVTLFGQHLDDLKEVVYTMRYDTASAIYGDFGAFYTGLVDDLAVVLDQVGVSTAS